MKNYGSIYLMNIDGKKLQQHTSKQNYAIHKNDYIP